MVNVQDFSENNLRKVFTWLTRQGMGPMFGSRSIAWYQMHQVAAMDAIAAEALNLGLNPTKVRVRDGFVQAFSELHGNYRTLIGPRGVGLAVGDVYTLADKASRK